MAKRKDMVEDLREAIQHLDWASYHLNAYLNYSVELLASYHRLLEEAISVKWLAMRCGDLSYKLMKKYGHKR